MSRALFILSELNRSLSSRPWSLLALGALVWVLLFASLALVSVVTQPDDPGRGAQLLLGHEQGLSQSELEDLQQRLITAPEVASARYVFSQAGLMNEPIGHFEVALRPGAAAGPVMERFQSWEGVRDVALPPADPPGAIKALAENSNNRGWLIGLGTLFFLGGLVLIYAGFQAARRDFAGEIELLVLAGAHSKTVRLPFILLGVIVALATALATGLLSLTTLFWLSVVPSSASLFRELLEPGMIELLAVRGLLLGMVGGGVFALLVGFFAYRYPKPFSLSRISSSSAAVKGR